MRAIAVVLGVITIVVRMVNKRWGIRLIALAVFTLLLMIPTCHELTVTYELDGRSHHR